MKKYIRCLGIDDATFVPHARGDKTFIVGCVVRAPNYLEGILKREIDVDGLDVTEKILDMLESRFGIQIKVVMLNGVTFGGFNVADLRRIHRESHKGVISIVRKIPNMYEIERALKMHFEDWSIRLDMMKNLPTLKYKRLFIHYVGLSDKETIRVIERFTIRGNIPEPLRIAHIIASGISRGESD